jgi:hypothetical protein
MAPAVAERGSAVAPASSEVLRRRWSSVIPAESGQMLSRRFALCIRRLSLELAQRRQDIPSNPAGYGATPRSTMSIS